MFQEADRMDADAARGCDAHFHRNGYDTYLAAEGVKVRFFGVHPWQADGGDAADLLAQVEARVRADARAGVGEIGLDRLKSKTIRAQMRDVFEKQLALAAELGRPVALHGAKCWGEVVRACAPYAGRIPAFLFHGFSRSGGLLPAIYALNGFVSVGPALLNDHAVNYRALVKEIARERLLVETDADVDAAGADEIVALRRALVKELAALRGEDDAALASALEANARRFVARGEAGR